MKRKGKKSTRENRATPSNPSNRVQSKNDRGDQGRRYREMRIETNDPDEPVLASKITLRGELMHALTITITNVRVRPTKPN